MNPTTNLYQNQNKAIMYIGCDNIETNIILTPCYDTTFLGSSIVDVVTSYLTPASIEAQSITATTSQTPCIEGTCTVDVSVTWINNGELSGIFVPNITIDDNLVTPAPYPYELLGIGSTVTKEFIVTDLTVAVHTICPSPNAPVYQAQTVDIFVTE